VCHGNSVPGRMAMDICVVKNSFTSTSDFCV